MSYFLFPRNARVTDVAMQVQFTELVSGDVATVGTVFEGLSVQSRYRRFQTARSQLPRQMQHHLADVRPGSHEAHVAVLGNRPVGIARWIRCAEDLARAELAIEVIDAAQSSGIGRQLVARAARSARAAGVRVLLAHIDQAHQDLRGLTLAHGATVDLDDPNVLLLPVAALLEGHERTPPDEYRAAQCDWLTGFVRARQSLRRHRAGRSCHGPAC